MTIISSSLRHENFAHQAGRLMRHLDISFSAARNILAQGPYRCSNSDDLCARFNSSNMDERVRLLSLLPGDNAAREYFFANAEVLASSLCQRVLTNCNRLGLHSLLLQVFGILDHEASMSDVTSEISVDGWVPCGIGPDPYAVISSETCINSVPFRLVGTRIYMPTYFRFGPEVTTPSKFAEPGFEAFRVMWSDPHAWYKAAYDFLTSDDEEVELSLPLDVLDDAMHIHQQWFSKLIEFWGENAEYNDEGAGFRPFVIPTLGCYLLFGFPSAPTASGNSPKELNVPISADNDSLVLLLDGQEICLEWFSVEQGTGWNTGEFGSVDGVRASVLAHKDCDSDLYVLNGWDSCIFFIRPAIEFDVEQHLRVKVEPEPGQVAAMLKTDYLDIAVAVIDKVARRDLVTGDPGFGSNELFFELDVSYLDDIRGFSLSLDVLGDGRESYSNLVTSTSIVFNGTQRVLRCCISKRLLTLVDVLGKKNINNSVQNGLVLHLPESFFDELEQEPKRYSGLKLAPESIRESFSPSRWKEAGITLSNLFQNTVRTRYRRDNF